MQLSNYELVNAMLMVILSTNIVNIYLRTRYTIYLDRRECLKIKNLAKRMQQLPVSMETTGFTGGT